MDEYRLFGGFLSVTERSDELERTVEAPLAPVERT
jgi:hypothetical protein